MSEYFPQIFDEQQSGDGNGSAVGSGGVFVIP